MNEQELLDPMDIVAKLLFLALLRSGALQNAKAEQQSA